MSASATYVLFGLRIRSNITLDAPEVCLDASDVQLVRGEPHPVPVEHPPGRRLAGLAVNGRALHTAVEDDAGYLLRFHGVCDMRVSPDLSSVVVAADPRGKAGMVPILFTGNVVAFLLTMLGTPALHGSVIEVDGEAIAFVGHSGSGKSTLAAEACAAGARLVADDVLALRMAVDHVSCLRGGSSLRLRPGAADVAERFPVRSMTYDKRTAVSVAPSGEVAPLRAVVLPAVDAEAGHPRLHPLSAREAFAALTSFHRLTGLVDAAAVKRHFHTCIDLAQSVPVLRLVVPRGRASEGAALAVGSLLEQARPA